MKLAILHRCIGDLFLPEVCADKENPSGGAGEMTPRAGGARKHCTTAPAC